MNNQRHPHCPGITRRSFLADTGMGFTGLALGAMFFKDGVARAVRSRESIEPSTRPVKPMPVSARKERRVMPAQAFSVFMVGSRCVFSAEAEAAARDAGR